jgi:hypothetical protein
MPLDNLDAQITRLHGRIAFSQRYGLFQAQRPLRHQRNPLNFATLAPQRSGYGAVVGVQA